MIMQSHLKEDILSEFLENRVYQEKTQRDHIPCPAKIVEWGVDFLGFLPETSKKSVVKFWNQK